MCAVTEFIAPIIFKSLNFPPTQSLVIEMYNGFAESVFDDGENHFFIILLQNDQFLQFFFLFVNCCGWTLWVYLSWKWNWFYAWQLPCLCLKFKSNMFVPMKLFFFSFSFVTAIIECFISLLGDEGMWIIKMNFLLKRLEKYRNYTAMYMSVLEGGWTKFLVVVNFD